MKVVFADAVRGVEAEVEMDCVPREGEIVYPPDTFNRALVRVVSVSWDIRSIQQSVRVLVQ